MNSVFAECFADELVKVACGPMSVDGGSDTWSDKFKGTPMQQAAVNLELQQATSDMQFDEMEAQKRERDRQEGNIWDQRSAATDKFRVAKKQMERQLLVSKLQQQQTDQDEGWQDLDGVEKAPQPGRLPPRPMQNMQQGQGAVPQGGAPQQQGAAPKADQPQSG